MYGQIGFLFNPSHCVGCLACMFACKNENQTPLSVNWRKVFKINEEEYISLSCNHCDSPECFRICPQKAFTKRKSDGIVEINTELCNGCERCISICPFGAPQIDSYTRKVTKCEFCKDRQREGLLPACVEACSTEALTMCDFDKELPKGTTETIENFEKVELTHPSIRFIPTTKSRNRYFLK